MIQRKIPTQPLYAYAAFFVLYEVSVYLANDMIMPGMVSVIKEFHAEQSYVATSLSYFILGGCFLPIWLSHLADKIGSKKVLLFGNGLFLIATIIIAFTHNIHQFLLARLFQGMGLGFIFIGYSTVHQLFDDIAAIKLIALLGNVSIMAPLAGPLIGGVISNSFNWRFVFVLVGVLGSLSFYGLYRFMPQNAPVQPEKNSKKGVFKNYLDIILDKTFLLGAWICGLNGIIMISWIGISPVILFNSYKLSFKTYATFQILVFSGTAISSLLMQYVAEQFKAFRLIKFGSLLALIGLIIYFIFSFSLHTLSVFGIFLFNLGSGLYISVINRVVISHLRHNTSAVSALNSIFNALLNCIGLEVSNYVCAKISYTLPTLAMFSLLIGVSCFSLTRYFARAIQEHQWGFNS